MGKPKIRFEGYSEDWEQRKLGDSCKLNGRIGFRGYTEKDIISKEAGGVLTFSPTNIVDNKLTIECKNTYITREKYDESPEIKISNGDILFVKTGSTLGKSALVTGLKEDASINPQIVVMRVEKDTENFMSNVLITDSVMKQVAAVKIGGAVPTMTETELKNFTYFAPAEKEEKKKIGDYFRTLDRLITLHQRKYDETKTLKKYMLQKMFPQNGEKVPEIRFDGFTEDWEQRKLGEVCEIKDSARIPNSEWSESGIPYIRASDVTNENTDGVLFISQERYEFYKNRTGAPTKNDVLFNGGGEIGKSLLITDEKPIYVQGGAVLYARTSKSRELVGQYLKTYFETTNAKSYIDAASAGGTMRHFTLKPSQKMRILMPSVEEQEKIGGYFVNLDHLITLHQRKCNELKEIKKYMLQNMFV